ncbi:hypothetical protein PISMIDRAFT_680941 [Pisolithus microcarpus 441]|uniref:Uncharacterized protein n=1 Tax=Pisolithus microcarpus 441 TaxID=765257 RepID=A0A0C9ZQ05_9AGAM|nr:hypothetical protein PISMIDRAFT_680941 [Pisolithus microcarpus 441]
MSKEGVVMHWSIPEKYLAHVSMSSALHSVPGFLVSSHSPMHLRPPFSPKSRSKN